MILNKRYYTLIIFLAYDLLIFVQYYKSYFIDPIFLSIIALSLIIMIPFGWGVGTLILINTIQKRHCSLNIEYLIFSWFLGLFELVTFASITEYFALKYLLIHLPIISLSGASIVIFYLLLKKTNLFKHHLSLIDAKLILCPIIFGLFLLFLVDSHRPPPDIGVAVDIPYVIVRPVKRMLNDGYLHMELRLPEIILIAIATGLTRSSSLYIVYFGRYLLVLLLAIGTYMIVKIIFNDRVAATISSLFVYLVNSGSSKTLFGGYFVNTPFYTFHSNEILFSTMPFLFLLSYKFLDDLSKEKQMYNRFLIILMISLSLITNILLFSERFGDYSMDWPRRTKEYEILPIAFLAILLISIFLLVLLKQDYSAIYLSLISSSIIHPKESLVYISFIILFLVLFLFAFVKINLRTYLLQSLMLQKSINLLSIFCYASMIITSLFIFLQYFKVLSLYSTNILSFLINPNYSSQKPINLFPEKFEMLINANYGVILYLIIFLAIFLSISSNESKDKVLLCMVMLTLLFYFLPDYWTKRAFGVMTLFISILIGRGFSQLIEKIQLTSRIKKYLMMILIIGLTILISTSPLLDRFTTTFIKNKHSFVADYEYGLSSWLEEHTLINEVIISDYRTMYLLNSLSGKILIFDYQFLASILSESDKRVLSYIKQQILLQNDTQEMFRKLKELRNIITLPWYERKFIESTGKNAQIDFLIVVTPRTCEWLSKPGIDDIIYPTWSNCGRNKDLIDRLMQINLFVLIYNDTRNDVYVFKHKDQVLLSREIAH
jgi:hypothetical protein